MKHTRNIGGEDANREIHTANLRDDAAVAFPGNKQLRRHFGPLSCGSQTCLAEWRHVF
jgi:hypothetical protein